MTQTVTEELAKLKARIEQAEESNADLHRELAQARSRENEIARREQKLDDAEDELLREKEKTRARARRRERDQLEKVAHATRVQAIKALAAMLPAAKAQAKKGKPALLRLIIRATR